MGVGLLSLSIFSFLLVKNRNKIRSLNKDLLHKQSELTIALDQKNVLIKEIHHRVKNNLQVISSLLKLQSRSVDDEITQQVLLEGQDRVRSMSLIHQNLYQDGNLKGIQMKEYLTQLSSEIIGNYQVADRPIDLQLDIQQK